MLSDATFATYYKDPEKYDKGKRGDFMTVGDIAYIDDEGFFYICDRKNDMIISGGVNIYPGRDRGGARRAPRRSPTPRCSASPTTSGAKPCTR